MMDGVAIGALHPVAECHAVYSACIPIFASKYVHEQDSFAVWLTAAQHYYFSVGIGQM
jgi:hypothetical protein